MSYISYDELWRSKFHNNVSAKDRMQDINLNQIKLRVNGTYKKDYKVSTEFEPIKPADGINKGY